VKIVPFTEDDLIYELKTWESYSVALNFGGFTTKTSVEEQSSRVEFSLTVVF
jgi:hypothetical protein